MSNRIQTAWEFIALKRLLAISKKEAEAFKGLDLSDEYRSN
jgi:hypothetical protein